jgi:uncharacterized protein (DUF1330 family)
MRTLSNQLQESALTNTLATGSVDPSRAQFDAFKALPRDATIHMLNLIRLKPLADYPADHPNHGKGMTGLEAYREYGRTTAEILARVGGRQVWVGRPQTVVTGPADERWDIAFIAQYPGAGAFLAMITDPAYREHVKHRTAAVEDSRLIRMAPVEPGAGFGE